MHTYFREDNLDIKYMLTDPTAFSLKPVRRSISDLKKLTKKIDHSALDPSQELYSEKAKKVIGKLQLQTNRRLELDEAVLFQEEILC